MAGPSIVVRVLGDLTGLGKATDEAGAKAQSVGSKLHASFSGFLGTLNKTGVLGPFGDTLAGLDQQLDGLGKHSKDTSDKLLGIGGVTAGLGAALTAFGSKEQASHQQLQAAIKTTGHSYDEFAGKIDTAVKHQEHFGNSSASTQDALRQLTLATGSPAKALQLLSTASDLAAARHENLSSAASALGKVYNGNTRLLKQYGINVTNSKVALTGLHTATTASERADKTYASAKQRLTELEQIDAGKKHLTTAEALHLRDAQNAVKTAAANSIGAHERLVKAQDAAKNASLHQHDAVKLLGDRLKGQASAQADTFSGRMRAMGTVVEDRVSEFGTKFGPAITGVGVALGGLGSVMKGSQAIMGVFSKSTEAATTATELMSAAEDQGAISEMALLWPIALIVAGIALLVIAVLEIWKHWKTIWAAMKDAVKFVWDWIKANWPLLLAIILGPIAIAALEVAKHWKAILAAAKEVWNWIKTAWHAVEGWLTAPFKSAVAIIQQVWNGLTQFFNGAIQVFTNIGKAIAGGFSGAFKAAFNGIGTIWNNTVGRLSFHVPGWVPGLGGKGFDVPNIPHLAEGGLITSTGFVYAHAGEAITPMRNPVAGGPAVHIENASFAETMDVDQFMRRVAWAARTARV